MHQSVCVLPSFSQFFLVPCPLATVEVPPHVYHDLLSSDVYKNHYHIYQTSSRHESEQCASSSSSPTAESVPHTLPTSGEDILHDMFLSQCVTSIGASVFHSSVEHLRKVCSLHGLHVNSCSNVRDIKIRLLYYIINGNCFGQCCEPSHPSPDCSACLCITTNFLSSFSITSFVVNLLKASTPSQVMTEQLLLIVESTGNQAPYENWLYLHRRVVASLHAFIQHRRCLPQQHMEQIVRDPF